MPSRGGGCSGSTSPAWREMAGEVVLPDPPTPTPRGRLFIGNLAAATCPEFHEAVRVTHVLTAAGRLRPTPPPAAAHVSLDLPDHPLADVLQHLPRCFEFLDAALSDTDGVALVHCASGVSRSAAICAAWLIARGHAATYDAALACVRVHRPRASPNLGFAEQLRCLADAGGCVTTARSAWSVARASDLLESAHMQREAANGFHRELDDVENAVAAAIARSAVAHAVPARALGALREALEDGLGDCTDRVARSIWRAGAERLGRVEELAVLHDVMHD